MVMKYGNLNFLEHSGPLQACNGTTLPLPLPTWRRLRARYIEECYYFMFEIYSWTIKARDTIRITAAEMKYMRITAGYTWTDNKTNAQITNDLKITLTLEKLLEYKRNWIQHVNRMPRNRLPRVMKQYCPTCRRKHGRTLKRLLDT